MAQFPNTTAADGIWTLKKVRRAILGDNWPSLVFADDFFKNTVLLLQADDFADGSQNNTFLDSSTNAHTITRNGNVTQGSFSPFSQDEGKWGNYFDGTGDYLTAASDASFGFGTGDFTIEFWTYFNSLATLQLLVDLRLASQGLYPTIYVTGGVLYYYTSGFNRINGGSLSVNQWYHIALTRSGTSTKLFVNGTQVGSTYTDSNNYVSPTSVFIGADNDGGSVTAFLNGYMSNVRIVKGTAVYTSAFTPPTAPLTAISGTSLLTCQSNRFVDNSSNAHSITVNGDTEVVPFSPFAPSTAYDPATKGGSGYFDGTDDYLLAPNSSEFDLSTGDFTFEGWFNLSSASGTDSICAVWAYSLSRRSYSFGLLNNGKIGFTYSTTGSNISENAGTTTINTGEWVHLAWSRSGNTFRGFINGVEDLNITLPTSLYSNTTDALSIGTIGPNFPQSVFDGYMSNLRMVKGTAVYTSNFTPPTAPVSEVNGTSLLCNFTNAGIYDGTGRNVLETAGDAQVDTAVRKYGTGSMEFDGTGDYLDIPVSENLKFGSGDFTLEGWFYRNDTSDEAIYGDRNVGSKDGLLIGFRTSHVFLLASVDGSNWGIDTYGSTAGPTVPATTWTHIAIVRSGSTWSVYIDGTEAYNRTLSGTLSQAGSSMQIGNDPNSGALAFNGYIDDLRITKGVARYTVNFTPPTSKMEQQ